MAFITVRPALRYREDDSSQLIIKLPNEIPCNTWEKIYFGDFPYEKFLTVENENATTAVRKK